MRSPALAVLGLLVLPLAVAAGVQGNGSLDPTFGKRGVVITAIGSLARAYAVTIQRDGKIVAGGVAGESPGTFALVRYKTDGSIDPSFGRRGRVTTAVGRQAEVDALLIQRDGKIVAAGYSTKGFALVRYQRDGSLDRAFGIGGVVTGAVGSCACSNANALVLEPDGKLVVASESDGGFALVRYRSTGALDTSFGIRGHVITPVDSGDGAEALVLQRDGKLVAAGTTGFAPGPMRFALVRYNPDGSLDRSFGTGGIVTTAIGSSSSASALVLQTNGELVAAGSSSDGSTDSYTLVRYKPDGSPDPSFGSGGAVTTAVGSGEGGVNALTIQADGKLVVAGVDLRVDGFRLLRYEANGSLDSGFGSAGMVTTDIRCCAEPNALAIQRDGKLIAAGGSIKGSSVFTLARYRP